jgi:hypothetical protein
MEDKKYFLQNLIASHLNGCQDVAKIILIYMKKSIENFNLHVGEKVGKLFSKTGYGYYKSWTDFEERKRDSTTNFEKEELSIHYETDYPSLSFRPPFPGHGNKKFKICHLLFIWKVEKNYSNCYLIKINNEDEEEEVVRFLKSRNYFVDEPDVFNFLAKS